MPVRAVCCKNCMKPALLAFLPVCSGSIFCNQTILLFYISGTILGVDPNIPKTCLYFICLLVEKWCSWQLKWGMLALRLTHPCKRAVSYHASITEVRGCARLSVQLILFCSFVQLHSGSLSPSWSDTFMFWYKLSVFA